MAPREDLVQELVAWLESERTRRVETARALNLPLSVIEHVPIVNVKDEHSWQARMQPIRVSATGVPELAIAIEQEVSRTPRMLQSPALRLFELHGAKCHRWDTPFAPLNFETEPERWIDQVHLQPLLHEYLCRLESLEDGSLNSAARLAAELLDLIENDHVIFVTALPVAGIRFSQDPFEEGAVRFRELTPTELGSLGDWRMLRPQRARGHGAFPLLSAPNIRERWALEVRSYCSKDRQPESGLRADRLLLALQLLGFELHGRGQAATYTEPGPHLWTGGQLFRLPREGETRLCSREEVRRAIAVSERIPDGAIHRPENRNEAALHRFLLGVAEEMPRMHSSTT